MRTPCAENHEGCWYASHGGCYKDNDHTIPRFISNGASSLLRNFIRSQTNQHQLCRHEHDIKTAREWSDPSCIEIPTNRFMIDALVAERRIRHVKRAMV